MVSSLLLLMHRDLLVELHKELFWVVENALSLLIVLITLCLSSHCNLSQLMVIIVTVKQLLNTTSSQILRILLKLGVIQVLPLFVDVLGVEVVLMWGHKG